MSIQAQSAGYATHEVHNQTGALANYNAYAADTALTEATRVFGADWADAQLNRTGEIVGAEQTQYLARQANRHLPELRTHDRFGNRVDVVEFHPAYHELMRLIYETETHSFAWTNKRAGAQVARGVMSYLWNQGENGICCPMGMTFSAEPAFRHGPELYTEWTPQFLRAAYDPRPIYAKQKNGITVGMAMTEKQGGSDLRATITTARPATSRNGSGAEYLITGHKWFFSVPMSDIFLTLAQTEKGLSAFVATGWLPDGSRNKLKIQRLKDKCGNKSNASSEVEFYDMHAVMLGEEGRGIRTLIEMAHVTRLDFAIGSSGLMRQALSQALHHVNNRRAFQRSLVDLPIMRNVVADLSVESEAMMWLSMRLAAALDREHEDRGEALLSRICTPIAKYWACKRAPAFVVEALECHGGNGFIGDHLMERLYREAPLNGIWEGTGNVICLDVLRAMQREPETITVFLDEVRKAKGANARLDAFADEVERRLGKLAEFEPVARRMIEMMAFALQASLLLRYSTPAVADAFCATRLDGDWGQSFGTLPKGVDTQAIVDRARIAA
ncbi:putative acyl-CoA dehydrogenase AidB [Variibacter gotjawalensis]|uniref:Putative acyl-CoA dehydrogenase AidB n=1 Tax=Variibacter gotjawalensis TaxID=1333996 RepID=A0A0S3PQS3_9BRAD|nr:acyl-CoA dehydrogenase family protein [Variibacter gotjawalensis]NIK48561.1 putative acyl-CoA dehydrogenase [Variibacter gotjawalensis]RZS50426.1 putative acyl-CoA dehydrogenase [Variibacter gotjawalensis]BAT58260.1 putative acyl-CoA dehydrogenase AidB [Variibacter gotjawalensis]